MTTEIVLDALKSAVEFQNPSPGLIMHTDLGTQYTSEAFQEQLKKYGMIASFSRKGCPYDNACIESFHATLNYQKRYEYFENARISLFQYIEGWYNLKRIHGSIGFVTPEAYEIMCREAA